MSSPSVATPPHFKIEYRFDVGDVEQARKASYGAWWRKQRRRILGVGSLLLGIGILLLFLYPVFSSAVLVLALATFYFVFAFVFLMSPVLVKRNFKTVYHALWETYPPLRLLHTTEIDGKGISYDAVIARAHWDWEALSAWLETPGLFMISVSAGSYIWLPKRAFAGEQEIQTMRDLLQIKLVRKD